MEKKHAAEIVRVRGIRIEPDNIRPGRHVTPGWTDRLLCRKLTPSAISTKKVNRCSLDTEVVFSFRYSNNEPSEQAIQGLQYSSYFHNKSKPRGECSGCRRLSPRQFGGVSISWKSSRSQKATTAYMSIWISFKNDSSSRSVWSAKIGSSFTSFIDFTANSFRLSSGPAMAKST